MSTEEKSGATEGKPLPRHVCMACIDRQRRINALRATLDVERAALAAERSSRMRAHFATLALGGAALLVALVALILWALGRLAVVIGGAS